MRASWRDDVPQRWGSKKITIGMTDPSYVAHDKEVLQEKQPRGEEIAPGAEHAPQLGQEPA